MKNLWEGLKTGDIIGILKSVIVDLNPYSLMVKANLHLALAFVKVCKDAFKTDTNEAMELQMDKIDADYEMGTGFLFFSL